MGYSNASRNGTRQTYKHVRISAIARTDINYLKEHMGYESLNETMNIIIRKAIVEVRTVVREIMDREIKATKRSMLMRVTLETKQYIEQLTKYLRFDSESETVEYLMRLARLKIEDFVSTLDKPSVVKK